MNRSIFLKGAFTLLGWSLSILAHAQLLEGTFGKTAHFYEQNRPFEGEIRMDATETAWRGERISQAIILWNSSEDMEEISFQISDFTGPAGSIPRESARFRSVKFAHADLESRPCGGYARRDPRQSLELGDILSGSLETSLRAGSPSVYWITMDIPASTAPGEYLGSIHVFARGKAELQFTLALRVVDYLLPPVTQWKFHLDLWQFPTAVADRYNEAHSGKTIRYWSDEHFVLLRKKYGMLAEMGQKVITAHIKKGALGSPSMVRWIWSDSTWSYDFSVFDRYVDSCMLWGIRKQISCHSPVGWNKDSIPYESGPGRSLRNLYAPVGSELYAERWNHFLIEFKNHLQSRGWFEKAVLCMDEVEPEKLTWLIEFIKLNHPDWKIGIAGFHTPSDFVASQVYDMSLMVGIQGNRLHAQNGGISTFYTSCNPVRPNNFITGEADPSENIWMGWHAQLLQYDGFLRWAFDYWKTSDPAEQRVEGFSSGDFSLSYRSSNELGMEFSASIRLELLREGIEDFEKIRLLRKALGASVLVKDQYDYNRLISKLDEFSSASAEPGEVEGLVNGARQLLNDIVTKSK